MAARAVTFPYRRSGPTVRRECRSPPRPALLLRWAGPLGGADARDDPPEPRQVEGDKKEIASTFVLELGDILAECVAVMEFGGTAEDIARTCHAHPTLSEAVKEAALAVDKRAIHM